MLYASTPHEVDQLCRRLLGLGVAAVGFDIEWRVTYKSMHCIHFLSLTAHMCVKNKLPDARVGAQRARRRAALPSSSSATRRGPGTPL